MKTLNAQTLRTILSDILLSPIDETITVNQINTDTRVIQPGDTFAAISGEQFDGHNFVEHAVEQGANAILVEKPLSVSVPQIIVTNTRLALAKIAAHLRDDFVTHGGKVIGVTGSVGKTTNKQMLAAIFAQVGKTHSTKGNLNNDLGVPFTWFDLPSDAEFAVIEMGANHQKEIDYLAKITRPQVAMITNAGESHLEGFGGLGGVAKGKGELFANLTGDDTAVVNKDDKYADYWIGLLGNGVKVLTFSLSDKSADVYAQDIAADGSSFRLYHGDNAINVELPIVGQHNVMNALGCAACALSLGVSLAAIAVGLSQFETAKGRLQKHQRHNLTIIDDTYNANPISMRASADILANTSGYRIMVLGDMGELGKDELAIHHTLGEALENKADRFYCIGEKMALFVHANQQAIHCRDKAALLTDLIQQITEKQPSQAVVVLVKGSRFMQMETIVEQLLENF